jgi:TRAP-type transport system periplasmic protein
MRLSTVLCGVSLVFFAGLSNAQTTLKLGQPQADTSAFQVGAKAFADDFSKRTQGRYKIAVFPDGMLGGESQTVESAKNGKIDLVLTSTGPVGNFVPDTLIFDIPFLFRDYDHARRVLDGPIGQELLAKFPGKGLIALAWAENGFRHLTNNKRPVTTPEDMKGLKLRTMDNSVHMSAFKALGALPTPLPFPELFVALQVSSVDGQENPIPTILSAKFGQVQKYLTMTGHVYSPALFLASPDTYSKLSDDDKKSLIEAAKFGAATMRKRVNEVETSGVDELKKQGVAVVTSIKAHK